YGDESVRKTLESLLCTLRETIKNDKGVFLLHHTYKEFEDAITCMRQEVVFTGYSVEKLENISSIFANIIQELITTPILDDQRITLDKNIESILLTHVQSRSEMQLLPHQHPESAIERNLQNLAGCVIQRPRWFRLPHTTLHQYFHTISPVAILSRGIHLAGHFIQLSKTILPLDPEVIIHVGPLTSDDYTTSTTYSSKLRYRVWKVLQWMEGYESRFAFKMSIIAVFLLLPWYLGSSDYLNWLGGVMCILCVTSRVGGSVSDLCLQITGVFLGCVFGFLAAWTGKVYAFLLVEFCFLAPSVFVFQGTKYTRPAFLAMFSLLVVSTSIYHSDQRRHIALSITSTLLLSLVCSTLLNWIIFPFVPRALLRKSLSTMTLNLGIVYRTVLTKYLYATTLPSPEELLIASSHDRQLRTSFESIRELIEMTSHEPLRPFEQDKYLKYIGLLETLFEELVHVRTNTSGWKEEKWQEEVFLLRRDEMASTLLILYILAGAVRKDSGKLPRYFPSAQAAREKLVKVTGEENENLMHIVGVLDKLTALVSVFEY
ncbi:Protein BRE4, partial [Neolecta irregularis DAH-3]